MFEQKLKNISKDVFGNKNIKEYFVLTHKKHKREMYFKIGDSLALSFAKPKFNSRKKRMIFFLLKLGVLQPFLKKIKLSKDIGDVVFVGGQIKGFLLRERIVNSFPHTQGTKELFLKDKVNQIALNKKGFAPKIITLDKKKYFSQEELLSPYLGNSNLLFDKILEFYKGNKFKKKTSKTIYTKLESSISKNILDKPLFKKALEEISNMKYFLYTKIHGDFAKEQALKKNNKIFFVDWSLRDGLATEDLVNFFRLDENYFDSATFKRFLKGYPTHIKKNLKKYLTLTELLRVSRFPSLLQLSESRLKKLLS